MSNPSWYSVTNLAGVAEISIHDEITDHGVTYKDFVAELRAIKQPVINLSLNSVGGSVYDGLAIFNALKAHPAQINIHIPALAASIATAIAMAADPGCLTVAPQARMMIHEAMSMGIGVASDFEKVAARLKAATADIAGLYSERSGRDVSYWMALMSEETWFTAQEAVDAGLADKIGRGVDVAAFKVAASFDMSKFRDATIAAELLAVAEEKRPEEEPEEEPTEGEQEEEPTTPPAGEPQPEGDEPPDEQSITTMSYREIRRRRVDVELEALLGVK